ncbi:MAG: CotH kinase family protein [Verrucomicrobiae bacterium]|nr:CotH kinase family protein [Verrucomicrobiae bacterium]
MFQRFVLFLLVAALGQTVQAAAAKTGNDAVILFSPPGGLLTNQAVLELRYHGPGVVHFTLDGSAPTTNAAIYKEALEIKRSVYVRARVFVDGQPAGPICGAAYTLAGGELAAFNSNLPLVFINTFGGPIVDDIKHPAWMMTWHTNEGRASLLGKPEWQGRIGVEYRGSSSRRAPKSSYGVECVNETNGDDAKAPLLGLPAESDWVLYGPYSDKTLMRDVVAYDLWEDMGHYSVRRRFVELFLAQHAQPVSLRDYQGVYVLLEKIKQGKQRVNIAKLTPADTNPPAITGGYILKRDRLDANDNGFNTSWGMTLGIEYPKGDKLAPAQKHYIRQWMNQFEAALASRDWLHPENGYRQYLDVPTAIDYFWIVEMSKTIDGYTLSVFMHKDRNGKLVLSPIWDRNLSFGNVNYQDGDNPHGWYWAAVGGRDLWYGRLFRDPDFDQESTDRYAELRRHLFATSNLLARVEGYARLLEEAQQREFKRWPRLGEYVWPNAEADARNRTYKETVGYMTNWIARRMAWLDQQFLPAPRFNPRPVVVAAGTPLTIEGTNRPQQVIYYTLDGSDPRQSGGQPSSSARIYESPINLESGKVRVTARIRQSKGAWGPPAVAIYVVESSPPQR